MNIVADLFMITGAIIAVLAAIGLLRFSTPYARFHAAGKASPVAFLVAAIGAGLQLGVVGAMQLAIAAVAMILTLPTGVHLLFRAVHRTTTSNQLYIDDLAPAELAATAPHLRPRPQTTAAKEANNNEEHAHQPATEPLD